MASQIPERTEEFEHGVRREWYANNQLVMLNLPNYQDATISTWGERLIEALSGRDTSKPLYFILNLEGKLPVQPTQMRDWAPKIIEVCKQYPKSHAALVIDHPLFAQIANAFASALFLRASYKVDTRVMAKLSDALDWQMKNIATHTRTTLR
jgi:hypothetical protein